MRDSKIAICISDYFPLGIEYGDVFIVENDTKLKGFFKGHTDDFVSPIAIDLITDYGKHFEEFRISGKCVICKYMLYDPHAGPYCDTDYTDEDGNVTCCRK